MSVLDLGDAPGVVAAPNAAADAGMRADQVAQPPQAPLAAELAFYESYAWCLNPHLTVGQAIDRLHHEIDRLAAVPHGWQTDEVVTNVYLLSCGLLNCVDDFLSLMVAGQAAHPAAFAAAGGRLAALLRALPRAPLPSGLQSARLAV